MTATIVNAAPMPIMLGTKDSSRTAATPTSDLIPSHLPKVHLFAKRGPTTDQLCGGDSRTALYHEDSFDERKKWTTHQTILSNIINAQGNTQIIRRLKPHDAGPRASLRIWLDVLPCQVPEYERGSDGKFKKDATGKPIPTGAQIQGFKAKWIVEPIELDAPTTTTIDQADLSTTLDMDGYIVGTVAHNPRQLKFGSASERVGTMTDDGAGNWNGSGYGGTQSTMYPIMDLAAPFFGADYNNYGFRMYAPTEESNSPVSKILLEQEMVYPFRVQCMYRNDLTMTSSIVQTAGGEQFLNTCFKPGTINKVLDMEMYFGDTFLSAYQDLESLNGIPNYGPFGYQHLYADNIQFLVEQFYTAERPYIDPSFSDFDYSEGEQHRFNFISGVSSKNVPYNSFHVVYTDPDSVRFGESTTVYATGASDGTVSEANLSLLTIDAVQDYGDAASLMMDTARHPESIIYDSGFTLDAKYALCKFMAVRKDTFVALATHVVDGPVLTETEEYSLAIALSTHLKLYPESDYFGTGAMRGMIMGRSGTLLNSKYRKRLPVLLEVASKAAAYMGASNGFWKEEANFDHAPLTEITMFKDINVTFTGAAIRNRDWVVGLNWVQSYTRRTNFIPALKVVYGGDALNDTSVLNSFFTVMACCELQKVGERVWRYFSGVSSLTNGQLIDRVNEKFSELVKDRFGRRFTIIPDAQITALDKTRGYSWTLRVQMYAPNMKTVENFYLDVYRADDLAKA